MTEALKAAQTAKFLARLSNPYLKLARICGVNPSLVYAIADYLVFDRNIHACSAAQRELNKESKFITAVISLIIKEREEAIHRERQAAEFDYYNRFRS